MTGLLDTSALLAYFLDEAGADGVQQLINDNTNRLGISVLTLMEFELRLHVLKLPIPDIQTQLANLRVWINEIVPVTEEISAKAIHLKLTSSIRLPSMDALIAATASVNKAIFVHRDPHFANIAVSELSQQSLPQK